MARSKFRKSPTSSQHSMYENSVKSGYNIYGYIGLLIYWDMLRPGGLISLKYHQLHRISDISDESSDPERSDISEVLYIYAASIS